MVYIAALDEVEVVFWYSCGRGKECVHEGQVLVGAAGVEGVRSEGTVFFLEGGVEGLGTMVFGQGGHRAVFSGD